MKQQSLLISGASTILLLCVVTVQSIPADNTGGQSAANAEREAWKKIREQTADFLAHEREYVMSQQKPIPGLTTPGQAVVETVGAVNAAPVAAAPSSDVTPDSAATTLPPVTTEVPSSAAPVSVGNATELPQTTTTAPSAAA